MEAPDFNHIRDLLQKQKRKELRKIEPKLIQYFDCEVLRYSLRRPCIHIWVCGIFLYWIELWQTAKQDNNSYPLPDYILSLLQQLMVKHHVITITDYTQLQKDDVVLYCWKDGENIHTNRVVINRIINGLKANVQFLKDFMAGKSFTHTFNSTSFKLATRIVYDIPKRKQSSYTFFFFNS